MIHDFSVHRNKSKIQISDFSQTIEWVECLDAHKNCEVNT